MHVHLFIVFALLSKLAFYFLYKYNDGVHQSIYKGKGGRETGKTVQKLQTIQNFSWTTEINIGHLIHRGAVIINNSFQE